MERYDLPAEKLATPEELGMLRVASETDEKNCGCNDAAVTPSNLHNVLGSRKANTEYKGNEIVACPYQPGLFLKCVQAGSTSTSLLDTTSVTVGQVIDDGGVKWEVINPLDDYLPLAGGVMRGDIELNDARIKCSASKTDGNIVILGGTSADTGAVIQLYGINNASNPGGTQIAAVSATGLRRWLKLNGDGTAEWHGSSIVNIPDYTAGVKLTEDTSYTASRDGFLFYQLCRQDVGIGYMYIQINGVQLSLKSNNYSYDAGLLPVKKGCTYRFYTKDLHYIDVKFYPSF